MTSMGYARMCPYCGAHLDPGEHCDCRETDIMEKSPDTDNCNQDSNEHGTSITHRKDFSRRN